MNSVVLVVEDDPLIRLGAMDLVSAAGFEGVEAANADEAIRVLEERSDIHLVFTDVEMPGTMDGIKLAHYIRKRWPPVQLIIASGRAILTESELPHGSRFFSKPYADHTIGDEIKKMLTAIGAQRRIVKMLEDPDSPGHFRVEIWVEGALELTFNFDNRAEAQKRYDDEVHLRGY